MVKLYMVFIFLTIEHTLEYIPFWYYPERRDRSLLQSNTEHCTMPEIPTVLFLFVLCHAFLFDFVRVITKI